MKGLLDELRGGDRRSIGRANEVARQVLSEPGLFKDLIAGLQDPNPVVRVRAADAIEKVSRRRPDLLHGYERLILDEVAHSPDAELRWHAGQMLPRLSLEGEDRRVAIDVLTTDLEDESRIVRACAIEALGELAEQDEQLRGWLLPRLEDAVTHGEPSTRARARRVLAQMHRHTARGGPV